MNDDDQQFARRIGRALDRQTLDAKTRAELRERHQRVLDGPLRQTRPEWLAAGAAAVLAIVVVGSLLFSSEQPDALPRLSVDELAVIAAEEELELLEEWEFYAWFDEQPGVSG